MAGKPRILALAGSTRTESFNKTLVRIAAAGAAAAGAEVTVADLRDFPMPLYDGDLERASGLPPHARRLRELLLAHQGLLIASPEYNGSVSGVLKNSLDWTSQPVGEERPLAAFAEKVAAILTATTSGTGGMRGLAHLRTILSTMKVLVLSETVTVGHAASAFGPDGRLVDPGRHAAAERLGAKLAAVLVRLHGSSE